VFDSTSAATSSGIRQSIVEPDAIRPHADELDRRGRARRRVRHAAGAAIELGLLACVNTALVSTAPTGTAASTITPLTGNATYGGLSKVLSAVTIVNDGLWLPVVNSITNANTANIMSTVQADVCGRYVVQPGQQFNLASMCNAAGSAVCKPWIIWAEVQFTT